MIQRAASGDTLDLEVHLADLSDSGATVSPPPAPWVTDKPDPFTQRDHWGGSSNVDDCLYTYTYRLDSIR